MQVEFSDDLSIWPGSFGDELRQGVLFLPQEMRRLFEINRLPETAERFLVHVRSFPTNVATILGWPVEDVLAAQDELCQLLKGHVDDAFLRSPEVLSRPNGISPLSGPRR